MKAIDIIERATTYYLLSNDRMSQPVLIGGRVKLEFALEGITQDMIIATTGNDSKCIVLIDYTTEKVLTIAQRPEKKILKLKSIN